MPPPAATSSPAPPSACAAAPRLTMTPDRPSARYLLPARLFARPGATLKNVEDDLRTALGAAGFTAIGYYCTPGGFALATQLERIERDGRPWSGDGRWTLRGGLLGGRPPTIANIVDALISAEPGRYRILLFYVGAGAVRPGTGAMTAAAGRALVENGADELPPGFERRPFDAAQRVTVLVYEFLRSGDGRPARPVIEGGIPAERHLARSGVLVGQPPRQRLARE